MITKIKWHWSLIIVLFHIFYITKLHLNLKNLCSVGVQFKVAAVYIFVQVEEVMKLSLRDVMIKAVMSYPDIPRHEWVLEYPGQIVLAASQVHWTAEVTEAICEAGLAEYLEKSNEQVEEIVAMVRGKLTKMARITLEALIVIDVHG